VSDADGNVDHVLVQGHAVSIAALQGSASNNVSLALDHGTFLITGYDQSSGTVHYSFTLTSAIDSGNVAGNNISTLSIGVTAVDTAEAQSTSNITIDVKDDAPIALQSAIDLHQLYSNFRTPSFLDMSATGTLAHMGADVQGAHVDWTGSAADLPALISNGQDVAYAFNGNVVTATADGTTVFTITANADGTYKFDQSANLQFSDPESGSTFVFNYTATDGDHDSATGQVSVQLNDHYPLADEDHLVTDVFKWNLTDARAPGIGYFDFVHDANKGGDVLDLRDLLQGEHVNSAEGDAGSLDKYLHFANPTNEGGSLVLMIKTEGDTSTLDQQQKVSFTDIHSKAELATSLNLDYQHHPELLDDSNLLRKLLDTGHITVDA
jgi:hypothetical protein